MVKEPVVFVGTLKENRAKRRSINRTMNEPLFFIGKYTDDNERWTQLALKYRETPLWTISIAIDGEVAFDYEGSDIEKEQFVSNLKEIYPEYLEWLLFHPEWLP